MSDKIYGPVELANNAQTVVMDNGSGWIENDKTSSLKIQTTDSVTGKILAGGTFRLYTSEQGTSYQTAVTDASGFAVFTGLKPDTEYWYEEKEAPDGYVADVTRKLVTTESYYSDVTEKEIFVTNDRKATLRIYTTTDMDGKGTQIPMQGVTFVICQVNQGEAFNEADYMEYFHYTERTNSKGFAIVEGLDPNKDYYAAEIGLPGGADTTVYTQKWFKLDPLPPGNATGDGYQNVEIHISNEAQKGRIQIEKISSQNKADGKKQNLAAVFNIYKGHFANVEGKQLVGSISTDASTGLGLSGWLEPGKYTLQETEVTGDYTVNKALYLVEVEKAKTNKTYTSSGTGAIQNEPKGRIAINKKSVFNVIDSTTGTPAGAQKEYELSGMTFKIYVSTGNKVRDLEKDPVLTETMTGASWISAGLDAGDYWIQEVIPDNYKEHYDPIDTFKVRVKPGETVLAKADGEKKDSVLNTSKYGKIRLVKWDAAMKYRLNKAEFEIYVKAEDGTPTDVGNNNTVKLKKAAKSSSSDGNGYLMVTGTGGKDGEAVTMALKPGEEYYFKETKAPEGYAIRDVWTGPVTVKAGVECIVNITNDKRASSIGMKRNTEGAGVKGAYIGAFASAEDAGAMKTWLEGNKAGTGTEDRQELIRQIEEEEFRTDHRILSYAVSDADGKFKLSGLVAKNTYFIMELLPPQYYLWNSDILEKTIDGDGNWIGGLDIENVKGSQIKVYKYTKLAGSEEEQDVEGVNFTVYKAEEDPKGAYEDANYKKYSINGDKVANGTSGADGSYISIYLPAGTYIVVEDKNTMPDPVEYKEVESTPYQVVTLRANELKDSESEPDAKFFNLSEWSKFQIKKLDQDDPGTALEATLALEKKRSDYNWESVKIGGEDYTITTNTNGSYAVSAFLMPGTYRIKEIKTPEHYTPMNGYITFELNAGQLTTVCDETETGISNAAVTNRKKGGFNLQKFGYFNAGDHTDKETLSKVKFSLYIRKTENPENDCKDGNKIDLDITTGNDGIFGTGEYGLDAGDYWLVEIQTGNMDKYPLGTFIEQIQKAKPITIEPGKILDLTGEENGIKNYSAYGKIRVKKVDAASDVERVLAGAVFGVYTDSLATVPLKAGENNVTMTTRMDGLATTVQIPAGTYYVREMEAPSGYTKDNSVKQAVVTAGNITDLSTSLPDGTFKNAKNFRIQITKKSKDGTMLLENAVFGLYATEAEAKAATAQNQGSPVATGATDTNGVWITGILSLNAQTVTYYLKELEAPTDYELPDNDMVYPVTVTYDHVKNVNTPILTTLENTTVMNMNAPRGTMRLKTTGQWKGINDLHPKKFDLNDVKFALYRVSGDGVKSDKYDNTSGHRLTEEELLKADTVVTTGRDGVAVSQGLLTGWYEVVEQVPEGYALLQSSQWVEITADTENDTLYKTPIVNYPDKGNFTLYKYDGKKGDDESKLTGLAGAKFIFYKKDKTTGDYIPVKGAGEEEKSTFTMIQSSYLSGYLEPGDYRIIESKAPNAYKYKVGNTQYTIEFALDSTPIDFTVYVGTTVKVTAYNSPKCRIELTKTGDVYNDYELLNNAVFQLLDEDKKPIDSTIKTSGQNGVYTWENISPGIYYIEETDIREPGYAVQSEPLQIVAEAGRKVKAVTKPEDLTITVKMEASSDKGRLLIRTCGESDKEELTGAVFEIYAAKKDGSYETTPIDTVTVTDKKGTLSSLLPASSSGTKYLVKETKAPDGYILDETIAGYSLSKEVTLYPYHMPSVTKNGGANTVLFYNVKSKENIGFSTQVKKYIREDPSSEDADETEYTTEITASESLLIKEYTVDYKIGEYAPGNNQTGAEKFIVTDEDIAFYYLNSAGAYERVALSNDNKDYRMNTVTLLTAVNTKEADKKVAAKIYVKYSKSGAWTLFGTSQDLENLDSEKTVKLSSGTKPVIGVKVEYLNVGKGFKTDGIVINTTFLNRGERSAAEGHEVRKIVNRAVLEWEDLSVDSTGKPDHNQASISSNEVCSLIPIYSKPEEETESINSTRESSRTGDDMNTTMWFGICVMALAVSGGILVWRRKAERQKNR